MSSESDRPVALAHLRNSSRSDSPQKADDHDEYDPSQPFLPRTPSHPEMDRGPDEIGAVHMRRLSSGMHGRIRYMTTQLAICASTTFLVLLVGFFFAPARVHSSNNDLLFSLASSDSPLKTHPVGLTAGVIPKRFHSHNDYEQSIPLLKALSYGASSVEADIWLVNDQLLVGHTDSELSPNKTLSSLYLEPLLSLLLAANEGTQDGRPRGVFETAPHLSLQLLIDIKTDGPSTFDSLYAALGPLRSARYLSTLTSNMTSVEVSSITVVGTGNTPLASVLALGNTTTPRDVFLDGPLAELPSDKNTYNSTISPLASVDFGSTVGWTWMFPSIGRRRIRRLVDAAHAQGIQARFWNSIIAPTWARNFVWQMLLDEGVDWLNVDDLPAARDF